MPYFAYLCGTVTRRLASRYFFHLIDINFIYMMRFPENIVLSTPDTNRVTSRYWVDRHRNHCAGSPSMFLSLHNIMTKPAVNGQFKVQFCSAKPIAPTEDLNCQDSFESS